MRVDLDGTELQRVIDEIGARGSSLSRCMPAIAEMLRSGVMDVYDAEGPGWQDLADSTKQARRGASYKILQDSGVMAGSTSTSYGPDWAEADSGGAAYAEFHATGTRFMPRRDPFDLGPFLDGILDEVADLVLTEVTQ